ncbi:hypothetical protein BE20_00840 [Sorangium cellulosum]|uniref:Uncharacterized protein n=1 Tax=Sorangium cellulosum TaxID=56 RepID=A0A150SP52_SORCE|nr:hypothetical protein BE18_18610 [Sorangium cellulosum]KYF94235.1 hypothetical protein BE20_00840 [Sorangium cellulosum]
MLTHLQQMFPAYVDVLGDDGTRALVKLGVTRAAAYGIVSERGVCIYVDVMFAFGRDFDSDPRCAWAIDVLRDPQYKDPETRAFRLYEAAMARLDDALGLWAEVTIPEHPLSRVLP